MIVRAGDAGIGRFNETSEFTVTNPDGKSTTLAGAFRYLEAPAPDAGTPDAGTPGEDAGTPDAGTEQLVKTVLRG